MIKESKYIHETSKADIKANKYDTLSGTKIYIHIYSSTDIWPNIDADGKFISKS